MANIITGIRIVLSVALLFFPVLSPAFFVLYVAGGLSDKASYLFMAVSAFAA